MAARVLIVDDEKLIVKGIRFSLEKDDYEVDTAYDGGEALEKAKEAKKKLAARVKELECQPKEVAVKDAAPEQLAAAAAQAKAEAQQVIDALRAELKMAQKKAEQVKPMAEEAGRALVEINILFGQIQTAAARIHDQLGTLDEVTRARVTAALASALARVSAS